MTSVKKKERRVYKRITEDEKRSVLEAIAQGQVVDGRPPTYRDIAKQLGVEHSRVQRILHLLADEERITRKEGARATFLPADVANQILKSVSVAADSVVQYIPILGTAAAGEPIEAVDSDPEPFPVPSEWCRGTCYLLRIRGESMSGDGIQDGDLVLVQATDEVQPGAIHVCWLPGDGATIKRVKKSKAAAAQLVASNENFVPVEAPHGSGDNPCCHVRLHLSRFERPCRVVELPPKRCNL